MQIFVLGHHLGFSNSGGLGRGDIRRGSRGSAEKMGKGGGGGEGKNPLPAKHPVTIQDGGIEVIYLAFRIPLRNNACTAG